MPKTLVELLAELNLLPTNNNYTAASDNTRVVTNADTENYENKILRHLTEQEAARLNFLSQNLTFVGPKRFDTKAAPIKSQEQLDKERRHQEASTTAKDFEENVLGPGLIEAATWFPMVGPVAKGVSIGMKAVGNVAKGLVRRGLIGREAKKLTASLPLFTLGSKPIMYGGAKSLINPADDLALKDAKRIIRKAKMEKFVPRSRGDYYRGMDPDWENPLSVYHGGANKFDRFNHNAFRGTGEGGAAYGEGNYVSNSSDVASKYANIAAEHKYPPIETSPFWMDAQELDNALAYARLLKDLWKLYKLAISPIGRLLSLSKSLKRVVLSNRDFGLDYGLSSLSRDGLFTPDSPFGSIKDLSAIPLETKQHAFDIIMHPKRFSAHDKALTLDLIYKSMWDDRSAGNRHLMGFNIPNPERNFYIDYWGTVDSKLKKRLDPALKEAGLPSLKIGSPNNHIVHDLSIYHPEVLDRAKIVGVRHANHDKSFENFVLFNDDNARRNNFYQNWQFAAPIGVAGVAGLPTTKQR